MSIRMVRHKYGIKNTIMLKNIIFVKTKCNTCIVVIIIKQIYLYKLIKHIHNILFFLQKQSFFYFLFFIFYLLLILDKVKSIIFSVLY